MDQQHHGGEGQGSVPPIESSDAPHPHGLYGATKAWGEAVAQVYADSSPLSCIVARLGQPAFRQNDDWDPEEPSYGISPRDLGQLFGRCIDVADVDLAIVHGSSRYRRPYFDLTETIRILGYEPEDGTAFPRASD